MEKLGSQLNKILIGIIIVLLAIVLFMVNSYSHTINDAQESTHTELLNKKNMQSKVYVKKNKALRHVFGNKLHSKDPIIRSGAINYHDNSEIINPIQQFFSIFYTFNSTATYAQRAEKLKTITSPNILNNKYYFNSGKDQNGGNYIDNLGEHEEFKNATINILNYGQRNIRAIVGVQYTSWVTGYTQETGERWYCVTYDTDAKQIVGLKPIYRTNNIDNNIPQ